MGTESDIMHCPAAALLPLVAVLLLYPLHSASDATMDDAADFMHDPSELFHIADTNFDHFISAEEMERFKSSKIPQVVDLFAKNGGEAAGVIDAIDVDLDKKISIDEFLAYEEPVFHQDAASEDFQECDADMNGKLSLEEYKNSNYANTRNPQGEPSENEGYEVHFKQMDTNADEVLEKNEFMAHAAIDRFNVVDDDKDGFITFDEYMAHDDSFYHHDDPEEDNDLMKTAFEDLDRNKDGRLSRAEDNMIYYTREQAEDYEGFKNKKSDPAQHHTQDSQKPQELK